MYTFFSFLKSRVLLKSLELTKYSWVISINELLEISIQLDLFDPNLLLSFYYQ